MLKDITQLIQEIRPSLRCVTAATAMAELQQNNGIIIDVREPAEFAEQATTKAINIPRGIIEMKASKLYPEANTLIYIHCATGMRASLAAEQLRRIGYSEVSVITCDLKTVCEQPFT